MEDSVSLKYEKYKRQVKLWEKEFKIQRGRLPSKHDIRESKSIRDAYKMYYKLKSSFLEDTLSESFNDDGFELSLDSSQSNLQSSSLFPSNLSISNIADLSNEDNTKSIKMNTNNSQTSVVTEFSNLNSIDPVSLINIKNVTDNHIIKEFTAEKWEEINENAWSSNLTNKPKSIAKKIESTRTSNDTVTAKLFKNANFTKRNPRKSLSRLNSSSTSVNTLMRSDEVLPDLETILAQKSMQQQSKKEDQQTPSVLVTKTKQSNFSVDPGWLTRCNQTNNLADNEEKIDNFLTEIQCPTKIGISNLNIQPLSSIEHPATVEKGTSFGMSGLAITAIAQDNSDDEIIENSDDDDDIATNKSLSFRHILKKRKLCDSNTVDQNVKPKIIEEDRKSERQSETKVRQNNNKLHQVKSAKTKQKIKEKLKENSTSIRRSSRIRSENVQYSVAKSDEEDSSADNTDTDANYDYTKDEIKNVDLLDLKTVRTKKTKTLKKNENVKKKNKISKKEKSQTKTIETVENVEKNDEEIENYIVDFRAENIQNVPQMNINELQQNTEMFEKYIADNNTDNRKISKQALPLENVAEDKLKQKIAAGKLNENFVRINIQKKVFVRGKKKTNYGRYKKKLWMKNKATAAALSGPDMDMRGCDGGFLTCFQCGQPGHFAQNCKIKSDRLLPLECDVEESEFITLKEAEDMSLKEALRVHRSKPENLPATSNPTWKLDTIDNDDPDDNIIANIQLPVPVNDPLHKEETISTAKPYIGHSIPKDFLEKAGLLNKSSENEVYVEPLFNLTNEQKTIDIPDEVYDTLKLFGHRSFRKGQDKAIMRVLSGISTLVTLSTGSGKSLCYQLPAYLYRKYRKCITLVISPLVSLMEDQVHGVPQFLNAQCLHTNQNKSQREKTMEMIKSGIVDVLLISPEAIVAGEKSTGFGLLLRELPPIAFVCIDEAHCVSQWSHNFRPSYLMICRVLREKLKVRTILGLTATATLPTRQSIVQHLDIPDGLNGIISDIPLPDNLILTISKDENRDAALIQLLRDETFMKFQSIIVYCTRRDECERIANKIRTCFQDIELKISHNDQSSKKRKRPMRIVESYHAGMNASRRKTIQNDFMRGSLKIVVATIAFGMGINKADIRAVIHYNMPMTFEGYVQEVGRAGRDGEIANCHLFLDKNGSDKTELRRHIYANSIDRHAIRKLLQKVFVPCACAEVDNSQKIENRTKSNAIETVSSKRKCPGHEICFSIDETIQSLDIPEENIATLLCYMELDERRYIRVLSRAYRMCKVLSYGGPKGLKQAAKNCAPLAMAIALDIKKGISHQDSSFIEFGVVEIASTIGWDSGVVKFQLKNLEWTTTDNGLPRRSNISVEFYDLGFRVKSPGDLSDAELDSTLDFLHNRVIEQERTQLIQLENVFNGLSSVAYDTFQSCTDLTGVERSDKLKIIIRDYFQHPNSSNFDEIERNQNIIENPQIVADVRTMISRYPENKFTGRALARIFHGVQSPVYPAQIWSRCNYWRAHTQIDFNEIVLIANKEIVKMRT